MNSGPRNLKGLFQAVIYKHRLGLISSVRRMSIVHRDGEWTGDEDSRSVAWWLSKAKKFKKYFGASFLMSCCTRGPNAKASSEQTKPPQ